MAIIFKSTKEQMKHVYVVGWDYDGPLVIFSTEKKAMDWVHNDLNHTPRPYYPDYVEKVKLNTPYSEGQVEVVWRRRKA